MKLMPPFGSFQEYFPGGLKILQVCSKVSSSYFNIGVCRLIQVLLSKLPKFQVLKNKCFNVIFYDGENVKSTSE